MFSLNSRYFARVAPSLGRSFALGSRSPPAASPLRLSAEPRPTGKGQKLVLTDEEYREKPAKSARLNLTSRLVHVTWPNADPQVFRKVPLATQAVKEAKIKALLQSEWLKFEQSTMASRSAHARAEQVIPLGVASSFQHWDPYPLSFVSANGAWLTDVDGRRMLDLSMGFGAMLVGHLNPVVMSAVSKALTTGTLFVTPSPVTTEAAERFQRRFGLDKLRFTNSGTEATMYALKTARAYTGRKAIVKLEGGYHGGYDPLQVSVKPKLEMAGPEHAPVAVVPPEVEAGTVHVVPYNDLSRLEEVLRVHGRDVACVFMEPVMENIGIVVPDEGYLRGVRRLCDQHGVLLVFDEVKTGLTAGHAGASRRLGVTPDLVALAKSIGGGLPLAAFGGREAVMQAVSDGRSAHFGTYNGNPLTMAAAIAVDEVATPEALAAAEKLNVAAMEAINDIITAYALPAHTVGFGVKGSIVWSSTPVRDYRDYKRTDFGLAELSWLWFLNRGILTPPGLDDQWLVSLAHTKADMDLFVSAFKELAHALRS